MDFMRHRGRITFHTCHLNQMGNASGHAIVEGQRIQITPDRWYALRDRSWGLRGGDPAIMPEPRAANPYPTEEGAFWQWIATQWPDHYTYWHRLQVGADRVPRGLWGDVIYPGHEPIKIVQAEFDHIDYRRVAGDLHRFKEADFTIVDATGRQRQVHARSLIMNSLKGGGYAGYRGFHHGAYMGETWEEGEVWDLTSDEDQHELEWPFIHEHWSEFECDGVKGIGMMEISDATGVTWFQRNAPDVITITD
jgi:hypothetical protein